MIQTSGISQWSQITHVCGDIYICPKKSERKTKLHPPCTHNGIGLWCSDRYHWSVPVLSVFIFCHLISSFVFSSQRFYSSELSLKDMLYYWKDWRIMNAISSSGLLFRPIMIPNLKVNSGLQPMLKRVWWNHHVTKCREENASSSCQLGLKWATKFHLDPTNSSQKKMAESTTNRIYIGHTQPRERQWIMANVTAVQKVLEE